MNYDDLTAKELRELCEKRGIKPSRAKADMIEDLKARDAADELTQLSQDLGLDEPVWPVEESPAPEVHPEPEKPAERPVEVLTPPHVIEDGVFYREFPRGPVLEQWEHESNLRSVAQAAMASGYEVYGPAFRAHNRSTEYTWVYGVNFR